jgi:hypothetical protein
VESVKKDLDVAKQKVTYYEELLAQTQQDLADLSQ